MRNYEYEVIRIGSTEPLKITTQGRNAVIAFRALEKLLFSEIFPVYSIKLISIT